MGYSGLLFLATWRSRYRTSTHTSYPFNEGKGPYWGAHGTRKSLGLHRSPKHSQDSQTWSLLPSPSDPFKGTLQGPILGAHRKWEFPRIRGHNLDSKLWGSHFKDTHNKGPRICRKSHIVLMIISAPNLPHINPKFL